MKKLTPYITVTVILYFIFSFVHYSEIVNIDYFADIYS
jgi:hypothetical protein